eukprot:CAMPEP_0171929994 /NCGR_PEP_ID=MMETSP0993-20121228/28153_1 /TAXON_ID=483369 /ORGANISM="non described non described, Strain CCMP2098" /LENGTH=140 /DNA_ID=CAMNT_0012569669 /DNA_START=17 /DNA_END=439 /DNA_ORIENTATION=-
MVLRLLVAWLIFNGAGALFPNPPRHHTFTKRSNWLSPVPEQQSCPNFRHFVTSSSTVNSADDVPSDAAPKPEKNEEVNLKSAIKAVFAGTMGKRDFVASRVVRLAHKINPGSDCGSDDDCLVEIDTADPALVEMAEQGEF